MSNKTFGEKKTMKGGFIESGSRLNSFICQQDHWTEEAISQRAEILAKLALKIWPGIENNNVVSLPPVPQDSVYVVHEISEILDTRIRNLNPARINSKDIKDSNHCDGKRYFLNGQALVEVIEQKTQVKLRVKLKFKDTIDPSEICKKDKRSGNVNVTIPNRARDSLIDDVMNIIEQAFDELSRQISFLLQ